MVAADGQEFADLLRRVTEERNVAIVCACHDLKIIRIADRVAWMQNGKIATIGTPEEQPPKLTPGRGVIFHYPGNISQWLYHIGKYTGIKKELLHEASEKYEQAIEKATILRAKPNGIIIASFVTLIVVIAIPQILIGSLHFVQDERRESRLSKEVDELKQEIAELKEKRIINP